jgi:hypothetical protein
MLKDFIAHGLKRLVAGQALSVNTHLILRRICYVNGAIQQLFNRKILPARLVCQYLIVDPLFESCASGEIVLLTGLEKPACHALFELAQSQLLPSQFRNPRVLAWARRLSKEKNGGSQKN